MRYFISIAKLLMVTIWGVLFANLLFPFTEKIAFMFYLLLGFMIIMHSIQLIIIQLSFSDKFKLSKSEMLQVFFFGAFKLWEIRSRFSTN